MHQAYTREYALKITWEGLVEVRASWPGHPDDQTKEKKKKKKRKFVKFSLPI